MDVWSPFHALAPLYLRTKMVPELEQDDQDLEQAAESQLSAEQVSLELQQLNEAVQGIADLTP